MGQSPLGETCNLNGNGIPLLNGPTEFGEAYPLPVQFTTNPKRNSKVGDLLFCVRGSTTGRMNWADQEYAIGRGLAAIRGVNGFPNIYVRAVLEVKLPELLTQATGSTFPNVSKNMIEEIVIPKLTPYAAQEIAAILKPIENRITLLRETNITLEAIAQALFKSWFIDFDPVHAKMQGQIPEGMDEATAALFPDSFEESELGPIPKGWKLGCLANLATFQNGYAFKGNDWSETGHPVIKIGNVKPGLINLDGCSFVSEHTVLNLARFKLNRGDLLVGMTGYVGETGLITETTPPAYLNQRVGRIGTANGITDLGFVYCLARNNSFKEFAESQSHGSAQANVAGADLMKFQTVIPTPIVVNSFNNICKTLIETILSNHERSQALAKLRDHLLPRLISGQIKL